MAAYKEEHQRFMSGHTGTSFDELVVLFSSVCVSSALRDAVLLWTNIYGHPVSVTVTTVRFIIDFGIVVVPSLLIVTVLSASIFSVFGYLTLLTLILYFTYIHIYRSHSLSENVSNVNLDRRKTFVTHFRSIVNLLTALSILAVDFQVFPRKLAKTEESGYGMMDFGVGFFVISNAIVSSEARGKENTSSKLLQIKKAIVSSLPLLVIGFLRLISVKGIDYQEHVTEYGVHWNFFFTLAALKVSSTILFSAIPYIKPGTTGVILMCGHQFCMSNGLSDYIIFGADGKGGRTSIVDANREGIFSLPGYIALYMMGVQLGRFLFIKRSSLWEWFRAVVYLSVVVIAMTFFNHWLHNNVQMVSRRFVNAAYVLSTMIYSYTALTICLIGDIAKTYCISIGKVSSFQQDNVSSSSIHTSSKKETVSGYHSSKENCEELKNKHMKRNTKQLCILEAISFNSLLFFLLANLMTGFVNMSMSTIYANTVTAMAVLCTYSFLLCLIFVVFYLNDIKTKFW